MTSDAALLTFDNPPVTEVVVALSFRPMPQLTVAHLGLLWRDSLSETFPHIEERPPYEPPVERFDGPSRGGLSLSVETGPPLPRLWFKSSDDQELLQVQRNWFACNWRKVRPDAEYGRWPSRRSAFERWFSTFVNFLGEQNLGDLRPVQCEVTYINHIAPNDIWSDHGEMDRILNVIGRAGPPLEQPEETSFRSTHIIAHEGQPVGRLHVQCDPVTSTKDGSPAYLLNLTARGAPLSASGEGVMAFLEIGRRWVVEGFKALTTREMHTAWGLHDE